MCLWRCWKRYSLIPSLFSFSGWAFWIKIACCFLFYTKWSRLGEGECWRSQQFAKVGETGSGLYQNTVRGTWALDQTTSHLFSAFFGRLPFLKQSLNICNEKICSVDCHTTKLQTPACWVLCEWCAIIPKSQWPNNKDAMTSIIFLIIIINPAFPIA